MYCSGSIPEFGFNTSIQGLTTVAYHCSSRESDALFWFLEAFPHMCTYTDTFTYKVKNNKNKSKRKEKWVKITTKSLDMATLSKTLSLKALLRAVSTKQWSQSLPVRDWEKKYKLELESEVFVVTEAKRNRTVAKELWGQENSGFCFLFCLDEGC